MKVGKYGEYVFNEDEARAYSIGHQMAMEDVRSQALLHLGHMSTSDTAADRIRAYHKFMMAVGIGIPLVTKWRATKKKPG